MTRAPRARSRGGRVGWRCAGRSERGSAIVEFVFLGLVAMIPLIYLVVAIAQVQQGRLAATGAARDAGRAWEQAPAGVDPNALAQAAVSIALGAHHREASQARLVYVAAGASCSAPAIEPSRIAGAEFTVCVIDHQVLLGLRGIAGGRGVTVIGRYLVHVDEFRNG